MAMLAVLIGSVLVLGIGGRFYSRFLSRQIGSEPTRVTPAIANADGRDYVPTPTGVVFAHHFAAIAGAGPILGPVMAIIYGWVPALIWIVVGGLLIGGVHDYLATHMAMREGGQSIAVVARRYLGKDAFVALMLFLIVMLALVCASFLNLSATALMSMVPLDKLQMPANQTLFKIVGDKVVIGGIASMSVIVITALAPLVGWMYIKRGIAVWKCSLVAIAVCALSIYFGLYHPISFPENIASLGMKGQTLWMLLLSGYVLVAAGVPVWILLQSRDFINAHILYAGLGALFITMIIAIIRSFGGAGPDPIPAINIAQGVAAKGPVWPMLFILIACGAVSGFHSLCAGGTTCKQLKTEPAARRVGYYAMLLESFLAVCVVVVMVLGIPKSDYLGFVYPMFLGDGPEKPNQILGFALAVGRVMHTAFPALPIAAGTLAGMVLLEGFLVTTLDAAVRLTRYLFEEIWRTAFGRFDVLAAEPDTGADGQDAAAPIPTRGAFRGVLKFVSHYWVNSGLAVAIMLLFAFTGTVDSLWPIFATANQLLAAIALAIVSLWLLRHGKRIWFAFVPAVLMLVTTVVSLVLLLQGYLRQKTLPWTLLVADIVLLTMTAYLVFTGIRAAATFFQRRTATSPVTGD
ncbi:MAG: carbon starvation CstA family protein [Phycisphaerae bacterium]|nr:carbon starvation CstA family protein [Phycisphaerae bacterium]